MVRFFSKNPFLSFRILKNQPKFYRFTEITSQINEEKIRLNEILRQLESNKRDLYQNMENERLRINGLLVETKESTSLIMNDKIDKAKEDLLTRITDLERVKFILI